MFKLFLGSLFLLFSTSALASNGWVASGGDLIEDAMNPWWIQNKKELKYCIRIDSKSTSATKKDINFITSRVLQNWLNEWSYFFNNRDSSFEIGSQTLIKVECSQENDLAFYFGWNSLSLDKKNYIRQSRNPKSIIGLAVRTHYDRKKLIGKGFIFVGSDTGPDKFTQKGLYPQPWRHKALLTSVLAHELAHVFGLKHSDLFHGLMGAGFLTMLLKKKSVEYMKVFGTLNEYQDFPYFSENKSYKLKSGRVKNVFGKVNVKNLKIVPHPHDPYRFSLYEESSGYDLLTHTLELTSLHRTIPLGGFSLYLTDQQVVFPKEEGVILIPLNFSDEGQAIVKSVSGGTRKNVYLKKNFDSITLLNYENGNYHKIVFSNQKP